MRHATPGSPEFSSPADSLAVFPIEKSDRARRQPVRRLSRRESGGSRPLDAGDRFPLAAALRTPFEMGLDPHAGGWVEPPVQQVLDLVAGVTGFSAHSFSDGSFR
jgi:hypothetical protein